MTRRELFKIIKNPPKPKEGFSSRGFGFGYTPYPDKNITTKDGYIGALYYHSFQEKKSGALFHTALVYNGKNYEVRCGDIFLEAKLSKTKAEILIKNSTYSFEESYKWKLQRELKGTYGMLKNESICKDYHDLCLHMQLLLNSISIEIIQEIEQLYYYIQEGYLEIMNQPTDINRLFKRYAFKKHLLIEGEKGSGKTYLIHQWCAKVKVKEIFIGGHEQLESIDFLGHYIQNADGSFLWKDGALSEAFRLASSGKPVVLIIDEILRIPKRELNILIYSLIAWNSSYILRTGRALDEKDGVASEETLYAPKNRLWVVGTTNVGAGYAVEEIDEALADRFRIIRKDSTRAEMENILLKYAKKRKFKKLIVLRLIRFFSEMRRLKSQNMLSKIVNIRHLVEAIELAKSEEEVAEILQDTILAWVDRDIYGYPQSAQVELIEKIIVDIFSSDESSLNKESGMQEIEFE